MRRNIFIILGVIIAFSFSFFLSGCKKEEKEVIINFNEEVVNINVGDTYNINVVVENAKASFTYDVEDDTVLSVNNGIITPLKEGSTNVKIKVVCDDKNQTTKEFTLQVNVSDNREFTITYKSNVEGFSKDAEKVKVNTTINLTNPNKLEGYEFKGWSLSNSLDATFITKIENISADVEVYAIYAPIEYNVRYVLDGATYEGANKIKYNEVLKLGKATKDGYKFLGWLYDLESTEYITEIEGHGDVTLYAKFREIKDLPAGEYAIDYNLNGGKWLVIYYTPAEIGADFTADFNKYTKLNLEPKDLDTDHMSGSKIGDYLGSSEAKTKWSWLMKGLLAAAEGPEEYAPEVADFSNNSVRAFYLANLNGFFTSTQHTDTWWNKESADFTLSELSNLVCSYGPAKAQDLGPETYKAGSGVASIPSPVRQYYVFQGWVDSNGNSVTNIPASQSGEIELKAIWEHETIAEKVELNNLPEGGLKLYQSLQLKWFVSPDDAANKKVIFKSLTPTILSVSEDGILKAKATGTAMLSLCLESNPDYEEIIEINIWAGEYFDVAYQTNSYVDINDTIVLNAKYIDKDEQENDVTWSSLNTDIASVDQGGVVKGLKEGLATIRATYKEGTYFDFYVTVLASGLSEELQFVLENHNSNAKATYNLGIGDGHPEYYYDVLGSANNLIFDDLRIDRRYYDKLPSGTKNYGEMTSVEFITVHYTGNMKYSADADNNCDYFNDLDYRASIHFVTGRTNLKDITGQTSGYNQDAYLAFAGLNEKYAGWHATNGDPCVWDDTGLSVLDGDPEMPVISISDNKKYTINGRETNISVPTLPDGYSLKGDILVVNGKEYPVFNQYGLRTKVVDGKYYLARTHWGTQREPRAICTMGGNRNSIGIESCVDMGSDLVHTWHVTAQLVAKLLVDNNLGLDRVVGHHFFSGKDCPQPLLENNMDLWNDFMKMVKAEYELITKYKDIKVSAKAVKGDGILRDNGLLVQDSSAHCVTYEVTVEKDGVKKTITLATCVESYLNCDCEREFESLQNQGYDII